LDNNVPATEIGFKNLTIWHCLGVDAGAINSPMVWWEPMVHAVRVAHRLTVGAVCAVLVAFGMPSAVAAPASDSQGYVDSTARCASPNTAVLFGSTETSRVAICKTPDNQYEYRGVRVRDSAKLIVAASQSGDGFVAENDGVTYTVTAKSLVVSMGNNAIRDEPMVDFHRPDAPPAPAAPPPTTTTPTTPLPPPLPAEVGGGR
jgi:hypothetical protein